MKRKIFVAQMGVNLILLSLLLWKLNLIPEMPKLRKAFISVWSFTGPVIFPFAAMVVLLILETIHALRREIRFTKWISFTAEAAPLLGFFQTLLSISTLFYSFPSISAIDRLDIMSTFLNHIGTALGSSLIGVALSIWARALDKIGGVSNVDERS